MLWCPNESQHPAFSANSLHLAASINISPLLFNIFHSKLRKFTWGNQTCRNNVRGNVPEMTIRCNCVTNNVTSYVNISPQAFTSSVGRTCVSGEGEGCEAIKMRSWKQQTTTATAKSICKLMDRDGGDVATAEYGDDVRVQITWLISWSLSTNTVRFHTSLKH